MLCFRYCWICSRREWKDELKGVPWDDFFGWLVVGWYPWPRMSDRGMKVAEEVAVVDVGK